MILSKRFGFENYVKSLVGDTCLLMETRYIVHMFSKPCKYAWGQPIAAISKKSLRNCIALFIAGCWLYKRPMVFGKLDPIDGRIECTGRRFLYDPIIVAADNPDRDPSSLFRIQLVVSAIYHSLNPVVVESVQKLA